MSGRGYLKKRLAEMKLKAEAEKSMNQQNVNGKDHMHENLSSSVCNEVNELPMSTLQPQSVTPKENTILHKTNTVLPVCNGFHKSAALQSMMNPQQTIISTVTPIEENDPVICRVPPVSEKNTYKITQLESNYVKIEKKGNIGIYEYTVDFDPPIDARSTRFYLLNQHKNIFPVKIFDNTYLFVPTMLQKNKTVLTSTLKDETEVTITLTFKRERKLGESVYFYNILLRSVMKCLGLVEFGRHFYDPEKNYIMHTNGYKLEIWSGYTSSIGEYENGLYLCCDVSYRVLRVETVLESVFVFAEANDNDFKKNIFAYLIGSTVITRYNQKTYLVDDIDFSMTPLSKFKHHDTEISFVEYYKKMYGIEIKNYSQFMIISKPKKKDITNSTVQDTTICLVPELCFMTGLNERMKKDSKLMKDLKHYISSTPTMRQHSLVDFINRINEHPDASQILNKWGLTFLPLPIKVEGPVYRKELIIYGNEKKIVPDNKMEWGLDVVKNAMFTVANLYDWAIFYLSKESSLVKSFCRELSDCAKKMGMEINMPMFVEVPKNFPESFIHQINSVVQTNSKLQLIIVILSSQRDDYYNAIKRLCCAQVGIPSQIIISRTLSKRLRSITQKIALQINCKLGGACWAISIPLVNTMIVGIDVYHEKHKQVPSIVGLVASLDKTFTQWCSVVKKQHNTHQEIMGSVQISFHELLRKYKEVNKILPEKIIIYRDGVSVGDFNAVYEYELNNLEECFKIYPGNYNPKITFIIVQKRINTRIYQFIDEKYKNPPSGTVLDNTITTKNFFDFFLVSQNVLQGTVNPTHYIVLKNGCNLSTENVQRLTYKLCHLYYNWCGTIKVPCPVQYAHKLAYLIGQNVKQMPNEKLTNTLFYL